MNRIAVIGVTGSGKTTFARQLADRIGGAHIELDALHWGPNWTEPPLDVFRERVEWATRAERWTVDGNYRKVHDIVWRRADTIVWLDFPFPIVVWRLTRRTFGRALRREELWDSRNRENLWTHFFTRDSLFVWMFKTYRRRKKEYLELFARPEYVHLRIVHLRSTREADAWLKNVGRSVA
jgi:adenylate kinase family enzyme